MFFQTIYQMMTPGTDLSIHIRKVEDKLSVAVMPRRNSLKEDFQQKMVPLVLSGNPYELDSAFLQAIMQPLQKVQGLLVNAENFEKQAAQAAASGKNGKGSASAESKEAREKREKMEKLLAKADDAFKNARYQETLTWLRQAQALAPGEKQGEIDSRMKEVQKKADEGSLFAGMSPEAQPTATLTSQPENGIQPAPQQAVSSTAYNQPEPSQPAVRTTDRSGFRQPTVQPAIFPPQQPHPAAEQHGVNRQPGMTSQPRANGLQPVTAETVFAGENYPYANGQQSFDSFGFDPEEEDDRELLREDPYAEYLDFPEEYRMRDQAQQAEMVYC
ncbi:MAG: PRTRC system protein E [Phocaeicola vulgatus]|nr:PRTRC system protein E [Phocaeicola vulgatus]MDU4383438.1 PRTRC system protein E [Phocaeicola vulgatus]